MIADEELWVSEKTCRIKSAMHTRIKRWQDCQTNRLEQCRWRQWQNKQLRSEIKNALGMSVNGGWPQQDMEWEEGRWGILYELQSAEWAGVVSHATHSSTCTNQNEKMEDLLWTCLNKQGSSKEWTPWIATMVDYGGKGRFVYRRLSELSIF